MKKLKDGMAARRAAKPALALCALALCCSLALFSGCETGGATPSAAGSAGSYAAPAAASAYSPPAGSAAAPAGDEVLRIYCWNTEFQDRFNAYCLYDLPASLQVEWVITPNDGNAYQNRLDADLAGNEGAASPIDIFLVEADYALKYVDSPHTLDVVGGVGLTEADLAEQYVYTKEIATDSGGLLKAVSWQATPGLFAYRRSIAEDVFGTDDPDQVQALLSDWEKFDSAAERMAEKGYRMLSGYDDAYRVFSNNVSSPWVGPGNAVTIDGSLMRWVEQTKRYTELGYHNGTHLWNPEWSADQGPGGKVFGFFYSTWGINFTLLDNSLADPSKPQAAGNGAFGDYAVCEGPQPYYWGGTWICAAAGGDNVDAVRDIMRALACDGDTMKQITLDTEDYTNNMAAMGQLAADPE
ncbi:MAG: carbohydrate ABC transporter substrate-binding protein, partial [Clostridiales bacterium]|nr:carbohydrate ABC transporter substrate-binding protein [Clostridiales bacterium]